MKDSPIPWWGVQAARARGPAGGLAIAAAIILAAVAAARPVLAQDSTINLDTPYFSLHSAGLDPNVVHELALRLTVMGDEYAERARASGAGVRSRGNIYLAAKQEDFLKWGGKEGSDSMLFLGENRLVRRIASAAEINWGSFQDTGFQLFASAAYSGKLPFWASTGLGSYYGYARWTGDGCVTGIIHPDVVRPVRMDQQEGKAPALDKLLPLNLGQWFQAPGAAERSHKAWAMVQFLMHADGGKYRQAFAGYVQDCAKGDPAMAAFAKYFADAKTFETHYQQWLSSPQAEPNAAMQTQATVATLTSFLARGYYLKLKLPTAVDFFEAAHAGKLAVEWSRNPALWLPDSLLKQSLQDVEKLGTWSLDAKKVPPPLILTEADGTTYTGSFTLPEGRRPIVKVERKEAPKAAPAAKPEAPAPKPSADATH